MERGRRRPSPLTVGVTLVVAAVAVLGFVLTDHSVASQNQALLKSDTTQAAEYVSSIVTTVAAPLEALASDVSVTNASPAQFVAQATLVASAPGGILLARKTATGFVVTAVAGQGFVVGRSPGAAIEATLARAGSGLTPGPVHFDGKTTSIGFAVTVPTMSGLVIFERLQISPYLAITAAQGAPFRVLRAAVYASRPPRTDHLVLANTRSLPLTPPTAQAPVAVGAEKWLLVASAPSPLAGGFPNAAPYIILGVGLLLALALGSTVEVLVRRHRYATHLVAVRTAELDASHAALMRNERLSALGEMASTIGHELRNPLAAVINAHFMVRHTLGAAIDPDVDRHLVMAERQTTRAAALADNLTAFVRHREPNPVPIELDAAVDDVLAATPAPAGIEVTVDVPPLVFSADSDQFTQVLANLIVNGFQAMPDGGTLHIEAAARDGSLVLSIADSGAGIDTTTLDRVFDPFFTTKASGTGLGLAIVSRIVESHGGDVTLRNGPNGGAIVTVRFPIASAPELARR